MNFQLPITYLMFFYLVNVVYTIRESLNRKPINVIDIASYIMGGHDATLEEVIWQAAITDKFNDFKCGATIIHHEWVVTSALCLDDLT